MMNVDESESGVIFRIIYLDLPSLALNQVVLKFTSQATLEMGVCKPKVCS